MHFLIRLPSETSLERTLFKVTNNRFPYSFEPPSTGQPLHKGWVQSLDWPTGLAKTAKYTSFSAEQAKRSYSLSFFANTAPYSVSPGVSRGQRSRAYLISFTSGG